MSNPFYHLRPNKYVDRQLFVAALERLNSYIQLCNYRYIGFGSYMFDDFKLMHTRLHISNMVSLECDPTSIERAKFNMPYSCIDLLQQSSTDFISNEELGLNGNIIWLDYTKPSELGMQFSDFAALLPMLHPNDVIRITLNAAPSSLGNSENKDVIHEKRLEELKNRIGQYIPESIHPQNLTTREYPMTLLKCLKKASFSAINGSNYLLPLLATAYDDGQQMLTFTGIIANHEIEENIQGCFGDLEFASLSWDKLNYVTIPELTIKEAIEINKKLPGDNAEQQIQDSFSFVFSKDKTEKLKSYISFYKYYPSFHSVNF